MYEDAGRDDPGEGNFRPLLKDISLSQHEQFENSQAEIFTPVMGKKRETKGSRPEKK